MALGSHPPPFGPTLLGGLVLARLPVPMLQAVLSLSLTLVARRHQAVFDRLRAVGARRFLVCPTDLPFRIVLQPGLAIPRMVVIGPGETEPATDAQISGPLADLLALMQGELDGDALFFSRRLRIAGDTEAVLILRNAVDDGGINLLRDIQRLLQRAPWPLRRLPHLASSATAQVKRDLETLQAALLAPVYRDLERRLAVLPPPAPVQPALADRRARPRKQPPAKEAR